ncbi:MAG: DUF167 domain-containing protein [Planctomycetota bacterium]|jgi:uncharacterized protein (TIGR00251 family)
MDNPAIREVDGGVVFSVKIVPGSSKTSVCGMLDKMVKIKISVPPEKGKANQSLVEFLAKKLGVKRKDVHIISGQTNPVKSMEISGISAEMLATRLGLDK